MTIKKWENFSKEEIAQFVAESSSYAELRQKLGYQGPSSCEIIRKMAKELNIDISHIQNPLIGKYDYSKFVYGKHRKGGQMIRPLVALRGHRCESCGLSEWMGNPIPLEVHHIDGDKLNNVLENLQLLCPNCHTLTPNWGGKNNKNKTPEDYIQDSEIVNRIHSSDSIRQTLLNLGLSDTGANYQRIKQVARQQNIELPTIQYEKNYCIDCGKEAFKTSQRCWECYVKYHAEVHQIPIERSKLKQMIRTTPFTTIGKQFGVSDTAIRKWCIKFKLPYKSKDIKKYSDDEWKSI